MSHKKKILIILLLSLIIVAVVYAFSWKKSLQPLLPDDQNGLTVVEGTKTVENINQIDTDADGLKDWEEGLWKTDSKNSDSDSDGTSDGDEVKLGRNPSIKGPDDSLTTEVITSKITVKEQTKPLNNTEKFSRDFFSKYLMLKQTGQPITEQVRQNLINNVIENQSYNLGIKRYALGDLVISKNVNQEAIRAYGNTAGNVIIANSPRKDRNQVEYLKSYIDTKNENELKLMDPIILGYKNIIRGLVKVSVPQNIALTHLKLINGLSGALTATETMKSVVNDPLSASLGISLLRVEGQAIVDATKELKVYFINNGIKYNENESGYIFDPSI